ncbi:hypothetical protein ACHAWF_010574, partial [Thalassiosira exigua]
SKKASIFHNSGIGTRRFPASFQIVLNNAKRKSCWKGRSQDVIFETNPSKAAKAGPGPSSRATSIPSTPFLFHVHRSHDERTTDRPVAADLSEQDRRRRARRLPSARKNIVGEGLFRQSLRLSYYDPSLVHTFAADRAVVGSAVGPGTARSSRAPHPGGSPFAAALAAFVASPEQRGRLRSDDVRTIIDVTIRRRGSGRGKGLDRL